MHVWALVSSTATLTSRATSSPRRESAAAWLRMPHLRRTLPQPHSFPTLSRESIALCRSSSSLTGVGPCAAQRMCAALSYDLSE